MNEDKWMNGFSLELIDASMFFIQPCRHSIIQFNLFNSVPIAIGTG
ncbi:MAG: hypothetical protein GW805_03185 [Ignavibacteria bacterium]|nr:hypothetical protein [Ignavibacteria bacterium]